MLNLSHHEHEVEQLKKEKDEALAEEMRNTKAGEFFAIIIELKSPQRER